MELTNRFGSTSLRSLRSIYCSFSLAFRVRSRHFGSGHFLRTVHVSKVGLPRSCSHFPLIYLLAGEDSVHRLFSVPASRFHWYREKVINMSPGERGCCASHLEAWRKCARSGKPLLVLEDDAATPPLKKSCCAWGGRKTLLLLGWIFRL